MNKGAIAMTAPKRRVKWTKIGGLAAYIPVLGCAVLASCVQVSAPNRPIEIVLTINIRQEVVYRLDQDAKDLIEQNTEIF